MLATSLISCHLNFLFLPYQSPCSNSACAEHSTCQAGYTSKGYRCICLTGFTGSSCSQGHWNIDFLVAHAFVSSSIFKTVSNLK